LHPHDTREDINTTDVKSVLYSESRGTLLHQTIVLSSSRIAYGSIRMEPVFMILGQSAATAASLAIDRGIAVQKVDYGELRERLLEDGQVLEAPVP
jgi:hypothetical protein